MIQYGKQVIGPDEIKAVTRVLEGDWLTTGPSVKSFEEDLSKLADGAGAVAVSSGTAALHCAYAALEIGPGDQVVTSPMTFVATAAAAVHCGAEVVFADIDPQTGNMDLDSARERATPDTKVFSFVDYAGRPGNMTELQRLAAEFGAKTLQDASHSIGGSHSGKAVGDMCDITTTSFFPTKNVTTAEGGAVLSRDCELLERAQCFRNHGLVRDKTKQHFPDEGPWHQEVHDLGLNYRLSDIQAALGAVQISRIEAFRKRRSELFARYHDYLGDIDGLVLPAPEPSSDIMWHLFSVQVLEGRRRSFFEHMRSAGIGVQVNYIPVYWHPAFLKMGYSRGLCPKAELFYEQQVSLPMHAALTDSEHEKTCSAVRSFFAS